MINLAKDTINKEDITALIKWLNQDPTPKLTKGDLTKQLEEKWANKLGTKYSVFVNSGSSAILLLLLSLIEYTNENPKNIKIVIPGLSWLTDVSSPMILGMNPILCDCNLTDLSCDLNHLEDIFKKEKPNYLLFVSVLGLVPDMDKVIELCEKYGVTLLEDCCESMGSRHKEKYLGSFGAASVFSTYYAHHLTTIEGGFINTNDEKLFNILLCMRSHGWDRDLNYENQKKLRKQWNINDFDALYTFYYPGVNFRSTDLQAFIGLRQIDKLDTFSKIRNENFKLYLSKIKNSQLNLELNDDRFVSNFAFPFVNKNRDIIVEKLITNSIEVRPLIAGSMGNKPFWIKKYGKPKLPNCDYIDKFGCYLPNHHELTKNEINKIVKIINDE